MQAIHLKVKIAGSHVLASWQAAAYSGRLLCVHLVSVCLQKCPFDAIQIINLPANLSKETTHRYGPNSFKLHRCGLPPMLLPNVHARLLNALVTVQ